MPLAADEESGYFLRQEFFSFCRVSTSSDLRKIRGTREILRHAYDEENTALTAIGNITIRWRRPGEVLPPGSMRGLSAGASPIDLRGIQPLGSPAGNCR